ncbi:MAG: aminotransferase class V-fold PLP-dependent enzyme [Planctomycetaceae bacterium]|jgi:L-seryl-tRNA(Ser) seleniumtransferase
MSIFEQWGVTPIINATGSVTRLGGAVMPPEVIAAFSAAASDACSLEELQVAASRILSHHTGAAAGIVTAGCAAGLTLGTAAILAGLDAGRMERLPRPAAGDRQEFLIAREQRNGYDHAVRAAGATLVEVGFNEIVSNAGVRRTETWEYGTAITERTAGILYIAAADARPRLQEVVDLAHRHCLPVLVDAAGEVLPRNTLPDLVATGADLVACSGGKALRGPQSTGILCGRSDLVGSALLQMLDMDDHPELWSPPAILPEPRRLFGQPRHGLGRGFKVSKEEIAALLTAVELFFSGHYDRERSQQLTWLRQIADQIPGPSRWELVDPPDGQRFPVLEVVVAEQALRKSAFDICRSLREGNPRIYVGHGQLAQGRLVIHPLCLTEVKSAQVAQRLRTELIPSD